MPKGNLKDKLDGVALDLSLSELTTVPVKDIAALAKVRSVDLSCNRLTTIPREFCTITNITKIDLSKNQLWELPDNIGSMQKLQHLDLYSNKLTTLPISIGHLSNLKWLDLKDNKLEEPLKSIAGDCLDDIQCRACATKIVKFMKSALSERERQRQKELQLARDEDKRKKALAEEERQKVRQVKKEQKERKRREFEAKREQELQEAAEEGHETEDSDGESEAADVPIRSQPVTIQSSGGLGFGGVFLAMISGLLALVIGMYYYCQVNQHDQFCRDMTELIQVKSTLFVKTFQEYFKLLEGEVVKIYDLISAEVQDIQEGCDSP